MKPLNAIVSLVAKGLIGFALPAWLALLPISANSADLLRFSLPELAGDGWSMNQLAVTLDLSAGDRLPLEIAVGRLEHPALSSPLESLRLHCADGEYRADRLRCIDGRLSGGIFDELSLRLDLDLRTPEGRLELTLTGPPLGDGRLVLRADEAGLVLEGEAVSPVWLGRQAGVEFSQGTFDLRLEAKRDFEGIAALNGELELRNAVGAMAENWLGEGVGLGWSFELQRQDGLLRGKQRLAIEKGAVLGPWFYWDHTQGELVLESGLSVNIEDTSLALEQGRVTLVKLPAIDFSTRLAFSAKPVLQGLHLETGVFSLKDLFERHIQPALAGGAFGGHRVEGELEASLDYAEGAWDYRLKLDNGRVDAGDGGYRLDGVSVDLAVDKDQGKGELSWRSARLLERIELGVVKANIAVNESGFRLNEPLAIPLFEGELVIEQLASDREGIAFGGYLRSLDMAAISQAMEWPPFEGTLAGMAPDIRYAEGNLNLQGGFLVEAFKGELVVDNLQVQDLFGTLPILEADVRLRDLDLESLTRTFSFGKISGGLEGRVEGLRLEGWRPMAFDARLGTPPDDEGPHRISQRAVDNISNLGGSGLSGAMSRSFLRFFDEFGYDELGISCRLRDGICYMGGIGAAEQGYYLVKGGGVPRIDIIGYNRRTDWQVLVEKLREISQGESAPEIR